MTDERCGHFLCKRTRWEIDTADAPCALTNCPFSGSASNMSQEETDRRIAELIGTGLLAASPTPQEAGREG